MSTANRYFGFVYVAGEQTRLPAAHASVDAAAKSVRWHLKEYGRVGDYGVVKDYAGVRMWSCSIELFAIEKTPTEDVVRHVVRRESTGAEREQRDSALDRPRRPGRPRQVRP
jgi:hypothetical protein